VALVMGMEKCVVLEQKQVSLTQAKNKLLNLQTQYYNHYQLPSKNSIHSLEKLLDLQIKKTKKATLKTQQLMRTILIDMQLDLQISKFESVHPDEVSVGASGKDGEKQSEFEEHLQ
jgi:hypothetical protein